MTHLCEKRCRVPIGFLDGPRIVWCLLRISKRLIVTLLLSRRLDT